MRTIYNSVHFSQSVVYKVFDNSHATGKGYVDHVKINRKVLYH